MQQVSSEHSRRYQDMLCLAGLVLLTLVWSRIALGHRALPMEDAAMLMRYAMHLAAGYGIVWNVGAPPVDGATDFLFMVVLAGIVKAGLAVETAVRCLDIAAHVGTVIIVYAALRRIVRVGYLPAALTAGYLALGPSVIYASMGFGTPFFAFFVALTWYFALRLAQSYERRYSYAFALSGLAMGLTRPEGVLLLFYMLVAILFIQRNNYKRLLLNFVVAFGLPALVYFAWHWHYFGYPLPNPYYIKGRLLHPDSLKASVRNVLTLCFPFFLAWVAGLRSRESLRWTIFLLIPIGGFAVSWVLLSNEMNHAWRFQYAAMPLALMSWPLPLMAGPGLRVPWPSWQGLNRREQWAWSAAAAIFMLSIAIAQTGRNWALMQGSYDGKYQVARALYPFHNRGYTIAVSEAGLLPLYSQWNAVDTWGLNDAWIAHHHTVTPGYLDTVRPEVVMFHTSLGVPPPGSPPPLPGWDNMIQTLQTYVRDRGYRLAGAFTSDPDSSEYYYVRADCPDTNALIQQIQTAGKAGYAQVLAMPK